MADKTINLHPYNVEWKPAAEGFVLEFCCDTEGDKHIKVKLHFRFWWIGHIARELWKAIAYREQETAEARKAMTS